MKKNILHFAYTSLFLIATILILLFYFKEEIIYRIISTQTNSDIFTKTYHTKCLTAKSKNKPAFECYEFQVDSGEYHPFTIIHESGINFRVISFFEDNISKIRFTPTKTGKWYLNGNLLVVIDGKRPEYAKGFVKAYGNKWIRSATGEAFIPQYIMFDRSDIKSSIKEFIVDHGFTGFHISNLRDFTKNPSYFESIILETYRKGGTTHFWIWGDKQRKLTPEFYNGSVGKLYKEIIARIGPLPGWTIEYGFDLFEWATADELDSWRTDWHNLSSYHHLMGGRGYKNEYRQISDKLDYTSWEWHRPTMEDYRMHIDKAGGKPVMSEDRFRVRSPSRYPKKDYSEELTVQGLWNSFFSGGVANIWGKKANDGSYSSPYKLKSEIRSYRDFVDQYYSLGMTAHTGTGSSICATDNKYLFCRIKNIKEIYSLNNIINVNDIKLINMKNFKEEKTLDITNQAVGSLSGNWILISNIKQF